VNRIARYFKQDRTTVDAPAQRPKNRLWVWYFAALGVLTVAAVVTLIVYNLWQQLTPEKLAAAAALWKAKGPRDYDLTYRQSAGNSVDTYSVRVRGGRVESAERNGVPLEERQWKYHSMAALFGDIERFQELDAAPGRPRTYTVATFDKDDGHLLRYVRRVMGTRERAQIVVTAFTPVTGKS
jgi:hypothetical protein